MYLKVTVTDVGDVPVPGAHVEITSGSFAASETAAAKGTTGPDGTVTIPIRASVSGDLWVAATADGFDAGQRRATISPADRQAGKVTGVIVALRRPTGPTVAVEVTVISNDNGEAIPGAHVQITSLAFIRSETDAAQGTADQNGIVSIPIRANLSGNAFIVASAQGFETSQPVVFRSTDRAAGTAILKTVPLKRKEGVSVTVTAMDSVTNTAVGGARVVLSGQGGYLAPSYEGTTDGVGVATVFVEVLGSYKVEVSQERYNTAETSVEVRVAEARPGVPVSMTLKEARGHISLKSSIVTTVTGGGSPLPGATVWASGFNPVTTDASGRATIVGERAAGDEVEVHASADGYLSQARTATMNPMTSAFLSSPNESKSAVAFDLVPGEDRLPDSTPIRLLVQILDKDNRGVAGVVVDLRTSNGLKFPGPASSDRDGNIHFAIEDNPRAPLSLVRQGLRAEIYPPQDKYLNPTPPSITADSLVPRLEERLLTFYVDSKPSQDLTNDAKKWLTDLAAIAGRVGALKAKRAAISAKEASAKAHVNDAMAASAAAEKLNQEIDRLLTSVSSLYSIAERMCKGLSPVQPKLEELYQEGTANSKKLATAALAVSQNLRQASQLVARCQTGDAAQAKQLQLDALKRFGEMGVAEQRIVTANKGLTADGKYLAAANDTHREAASRLAQFDALASKAEDAATSAGLDYVASMSQMNDLRAIYPPILTEVRRLSAEHLRITSAGYMGFPPNAYRQITDLESVTLANSPGTLDASIMAGYRGTAAQQSSTVNGLKEVTAKLLTDHPAPPCTIKSYDALVEDAANKMMAAEEEILNAADLPAQADQCSQKATCQPLTRDVLPLLESGAIEMAQTKLNQARAQGCNVSDLDQDLDYFRTIRDAATYLHVLGDQCRFNDASEWARRIPASARAWPILATEISRVNSGLEAQIKVSDLLSQTRQAVQAGNLAQANQYHRMAELAGGPYTCLATQVSNVKVPGAQSTGGATTKTGTTVSPAGTLHRGKPEVKANHKDPYAPYGKDQGGDSYTYTDSSSDLVHVHTNYAGELQEQIHVHWTYTVPANIPPNGTVTVKVTGSMTSQPANASANWAVSAWVAATGLDLKSSKMAAMNPKGKQDGEYVFTVSPNATSATITLSADFGIGDAAVLHFEK